jgi:hypothetical protein
MKKNGLKWQNNVWKENIIVQKENIEIFVLNPMNLNSYPTLNFYSKK